MKAVSPSDEEARLRALHQYGILDTDPEEAFDDIVHLAAQICGTAMASINLIDADRQWLKAKVGLEIKEIPIEAGLCKICIQQREPLIVFDTWADEQLKTNSVVTSYPYVRFYAGIPLIAPQGEAIGTLFAIDRVPRKITDEQVEALKALSRQVVANLELRRNLANLASANMEHQQLQKQLKQREKELSDFVENAPIGLHWVGPDGKILWANQAELDLLGYSCEEYIGHHIGEFHADKEVIGDILRRLTAKETLHNYEARLRCKDGSIKYVLIDSNVFWEDDKFIHTRCFTRDITDRQRSEALLQERQKAIAQQEELLRNVLNTIPVGVSITDKQGLILQANPAAQAIWGLKKENIALGNSHFCLNSNSTKNSYQVWWTDTGKLIEPQEWALFRAITKGETSLNECIDIQRFDGKRKTILNSAVPLRNEQQQIIGAIIVSQDITEEQLVKQALWENQRLFQKIADATPQILYLHDLVEKRNIYVNRQITEILGYPPEAVQQMEGFPQPLIHPEDWPKLVENLKRLSQAKDGEIIEIEYRMRRANGEWCWLISRDTVFSRTTDNLPQLILGTATDITKRKEAELKIREQAALLDIATDAIFVKDTNNKILFWNKGAERLYGWKTEEVIGKNAYEILHMKTINRLDIQKTLLEKGEWQGELQERTKEGKEIIVESRWTLVYDETHRPKSVLVVNTDITDKKQLEAQFLRAQRMESIGTLASGIAHDLNNLLTPILMAVQLLETQLQDERSLQLLPILKNNAKRGAELVKQVLSFGRGMQGHRTIVQVKHIVSEIRHIVKETFPKSIEFFSDVPPDIWTVFADATQLHQVLLNLSVNARDAMPNGGTLAINVKNLFIDESWNKINIDAGVGQYIEITVADTGIGIPPEIIDRIFEPFFTTKEVGKGTGLGLSTLIGIIKSHGGFVNVSSEVGRGSQFKLYLPAQEVAENRQLEDRQIPKGAGELILVVDDEASIREITKTSLETYGYRVISASDGREAIALYKQYQEEICLVLLDMMMPYMDGLTAMSILLKINPNVKIIAMSGLTSNSSAIQATGNKLKRFLAKPYTAEELLTALKEELRQNR